MPMGSRESDLEGASPGRTRKRSFTLVNGRNIKERMSDPSGGGEKNNDTDDEDVCDMCDLGDLCVPKN